MNQHLLSQSEINHYHNEGFLIPQITLAEYEVGELKHTVDRVLDANSGIRPEQRISVHIDRLNDVFSWYSIPFKKPLSPCVGSKFLA